MRLTVGEISGERNCKVRCLEPPGIYDVKKGIIDFSRKPLGSPPKSSRHLNNKENGCQMFCNNRLQVFYSTTHKVQPEPGVLEFNLNSGPSRSLRAAQPELRYQMTSHNSCIRAAFSPCSTGTARSKLNQNFDIHFSSSVEEEVFEAGEFMSPESSAFFAHHLQTVS